VFTNAGIIIAEAELEVKTGNQKFGS